MDYTWQTDVGDGILSQAGMEFSKQAKGGVGHVRLKWRGEFAANGRRGVCFVGMSCVLGRWGGDGVVMRTDVIEEVLKKGARSC
jgi:hypothetical protein